MSCLQLYFLLLYIISLEYSSRLPGCGRGRVKYAGRRGREQDYAKSGSHRAVEKAWSNYKVEPVLQLELRLSAGH